MTYEELGIDPTRLKRDYIKNPIKKIQGLRTLVWERPFKEDLIYLHHECNLPIRIICKHLKLPLGLVHSILGNYYTKPTALPTEELYKEFGIDKNRLKRDYIKNPLKRDKHNRIIEVPEKDDIEYLYNGIPLSNEQLKQFFCCTKMQYTRFLMAYNICRTKENEQLLREKTFKERFGVINLHQHPRYKRESIETIKEIYGVENVSTNKEIQKKKEATYLKHYGAKSYGESEEGRRVLSESQLKLECKRKGYLTRKKNNSFNISKVEDECYRRLKKVFPDAIHQYKSKQYPFNCDFYVPELDLYIEYQGSWRHGIRGKSIYGPFDSGNPDHIKHLQYLKQREQALPKNKRGKNGYTDAIKIWTIRDPLKRQTARKNNLNWLEFFTMDEFNNWLMQQASKKSMEPVSL